MKKLILFCVGMSYALCTQAQPKPATTPTPAVVKDEKATTNAIPFNPDASVVTEHVTTIKGQ